MNKLLMRRIILRNRGPEFGEETMSASETMFASETFHLPLFELE